MKKPKKRKLAALQRFSAAKAKRDAARIAAEREYEATVENVIFSDIEKILRVYEDPGLSPKERLEIFKSAKGAWPRIVLGFYEAERAIAEKQKKENPDEGEPSDIAYEKVGKFIGVGEDRVKALCNEGRRQIREGLPDKLKVRKSIAEFKKLLHDLSTNDRLTRHA
jgi:hypothetical protein